jgi:Leu/Phe-tRNA-protein transferase
MMDTLYAVHYACARKNATAPEQWMTEGKTAYTECLETNYAHFQSSFSD